MDDVNARRLRLFRRAPNDIAAEIFDRARVRLDRASHHGGQRRFARAIFSQKRVDLAWRHVEVDTVEAFHPGVGFLDTCQPDDGARHTTILLGATEAGERPTVGAVDRNCPVTSDIVG